MQDFICNFFWSLSFGSSLISLVFMILLYLLICPITWLLTSTFCFFASVIPVAYHDSTTIVIPCKTSYATSFYHFLLVFSPISLIFKILLYLYVRLLDFYVLFLSFCHSRCSPRQYQHSYPMQDLICNFFPSLFTLWEMFKRKLQLMFQFFH